VAARGARGRDQGLGPRRHAHYHTAGTGLRRAVPSQGTFRLKQRFTNNNGLTVLERVDATTAAAPAGMMARGESTGFWTFRKQQPRKAIRARQRRPRQGIFHAMSACPVRTTRRSKGFAACASVSLKIATSTVWNP
jgi:hypothetical protein